MIKIEFMQEIESYLLLFKNKYKNNVKHYIDYQLYQLKVFNTNGFLNSLSTKLKIIIWISGQGNKNLYKIVCILTVKLALISLKSRAMQ